MHLHSFILSLFFAMEFYISVITLSKVVTLESGAKKIVFFALRPLRVGEEVFYDYKFPIEDDKIPCTCGAPKCRRFLN